MSSDLPQWRKFFTSEFWTTKRSGKEWGPIYVGALVTLALVGIFFAIQVATRNGSVATFWSIVVGLGGLLTTLFGRLRDNNWVFFIGVVLAMIGIVLPAWVG